VAIIAHFLQFSLARKPTGRYDLMDVVKHILLLATLSCCAPPPSQQASQLCKKQTIADQSSLNIEGGTETSDYPSVVLIVSEMSGTIQQCTGTIVGHNVVITAAHCMTATPESTYVLQPTSPWTIGMLQASKRTAAKPTTILVNQSPNTKTTDINGVASDFAVLIFANNTFTQSDVSIPSLFKLPKPQRFSDAVMVGFGLKSASDDGRLSIKRSAPNKIENLLEEVLGIIQVYARELDPTTGKPTGPVIYGMTHAGDSGGPLLIKNGNKLEIVGTLSKAITPGQAVERYAVYVSLYNAKSIKLLEDAIKKGAVFNKPSSENKSTATKPSNSPQKKCMH